MVGKPEKPRGKADQAYAAAAVRHEAEYYIPIEHHNPMELYASTVLWDGDGKLTVYDKTQGVQNVQHYLCGVFKMKPDDVRVVSPFVGGAFGSGLRPQYQVALAVLAARALERSVRLVLTRRQMYGLGYRPATIERLAIGAEADGTLDAISHEAIAVTSQYEDFSRNDTGWSGQLYKSASAKYLHKLVRLDLATPSDMRAPGAATGVYALECAMDELAVALELDPLELRLRCYSDRNQHEDVPYTSKNLRECYRQGAAAFGWSKRSAAPRSMRDGSELVGWGMATGIWEALQMERRRPHRADGERTRRGRIRVLRHRHRHLHHHGAGGRRHARPAARQCHRQARRLDTAAAPVEGGSWTAASVSHAISRTAEEVRQELLRLAKTIPKSPLAGSKPKDVALVDGNILNKATGRAVSIADAMRHGAVDRIERESTTDFKDFELPCAQHALGDLRRGQGRRGTRCHSRDPRRQCGRGRAHPQSQDRAQSDHGSRGVGHRHGAARGDAARPRIRPHHERQYRRVSCAGECRRARHRRHLRR